MRAGARGWQWRVWGGLAEASAACAAALPHSTTAPLLPQVAPAETTARRRLLAASDAPSASLTAAASQMAGTEAVERLALSVPTGLLAALVVLGVCGVLVAALALVTRGHNGSLPL